MESETYPQKKRMHNGHAVRQLRVDKRLSQEEFGKLIGMTQPSVCRYEEKEKIEEDILARMAKALKVSVDFIKEMEEDKSLTFYIENNTFTNSNTDNSTAVANPVESNIHITSPDKSLYTVLEQMQKLYDSGMELYKNSLEAYQHVLKRTEEKIVTLENKISELENKK